MTVRSAVTMLAACALGLTCAVAPTAQSASPFNETLLRPFTLPEPRTVPDGRPHL